MTGQRHCSCSLASVAGGSGVKLLPFCGETGLHFCETQPSSVRREADRLIASIPASGRAGGRARGRGAGGGGAGGGVVSD